MHKIMDNAVLLVGNGINQAFENSSDDPIPKKGNWNFRGMSWKSIVKQIILNCNPDLKYDDISELPMTLQIITASKDDVKTVMKSLSESMVADKIADEKSLFLQKVLELPIKNILTTNYSYELEQAAGIPAKKYYYFRCRKDTVAVTKSIKYLRLYTYSDLSQLDRKIWHIHGDVATPDSVIMGHFYYGKLLREIQLRIRNFMPYCKGCIRQGEDFESKSWVDMFLTRDVYMFGFGFDFSEMDLWWLAACKKKDFPDTKIHYYAPKGEITPGKRALFEAYDIKLHEKFAVNDKDYISYYSKVLKDIKNNLEEGQPK